jgi:ABC-type branched-subunit amino acid transport system substrate-binding protein
LLRGGEAEISLCEILPQSRHWQQRCNRAYSQLHRSDGSSSCPKIKTARAAASMSGRTMMHHHRLSYANCVKSAVLAGLLTIAVASAANAQKKYDPGATDTEIKVGNIMPYSGPASAYATIGKTEAAYFNKLNSEGGINGRKVNFISYDDAYSPPKMVEQARTLVERYDVLNSSSKCDG